MSQIQWDQGQILELSGGYWKTCALHAAVKLDIFTILGDKQMTAEEIAEEIPADIDAISRLLDALAAMGFLVKTDDAHENTDAAQTFLNRNSSSYIGYIVTHHHHLMESWNRLDEAVKTGEPVREKMSFSEGEWRKNFLMGMFNLASGLAPKLVPAIDFSGRRHLLDLGGGPGTYAIHFCIYNPNLRATVFDLPTTRPFAEETIEKYGLSERIDFQEGNYLEQEIAGKYDCAWLSHILHGESFRQCRNIVKKTVSALSSGASIVIHEFILNDSKDGPVFPALFSLNMLLGTDAGRAYSEKELREMLSEAGVTDIRRIAVQTPNDSGIIIGTVP